MNTVQIILGHLQEPKTNNMNEYKKYITVLDFDEVEVFVYPIEGWNIENKDIKEKLSILGHDVSNCKWMVHKDKPIIH